MRTAENQHRQQQRKHSNGGKGNVNHLQMHQPSGGNIPQNTNHFAVAIDHRAGNGDNMLAGVGVNTYKILYLPTVHGGGDLRGVRRTATPMAIGRGNQYTVCIDKLQFHIAAEFKVFGVCSARLIVIIIILANVAAEELTGLRGAGFHIRTHIGIVVHREGDANQHNAQDTKNAEHDYRI